MSQMMSRLGGANGPYGPIAPGTAYRVGPDGKRVAINSYEIETPVQEFRTTKVQNIQIVKPGPVIRRASAAAVVDVGVAVAPVAAVVPENLSSYVWAIAMLGLFIAIFCVTIIILLFVVSLQNNRIASSILAGLSAVFAVIMVALMFRYDRLVGNPSEVMAETDTTVVAQAAPMQEEVVVEQPMVEQTVVATPAVVTTAPVVATAPVVTAAPSTVTTTNPLTGTTTTATTTEPAVAVAAPAGGYYGGNYGYGPGYGYGYGGHGYAGSGNSYGGGQYPHHYNYR